MDAELRCVLLITSCFLRGLNLIQYRQIGNYRISISVYQRRLPDDDIRRSKISNCYLGNETIWGAIVLKTWEAMQGMVSKVGYKINCVHCAVFFAPTRPS